MFYLNVSCFFVHYYISLGCFIYVDELYSYCMHWKLALKDKLVTYEISQNAAWKLEAVLLKCHMTNISPIHVAVCCTKGKDLLAFVFILQPLKNEYMYMYSVFITEE